MLGAQDQSSAVLREYLSIICRRHFPACGSKDRRLRSTSQATLPWEWRGDHRLRMRRRRGCLPRNLTLMLESPKTGHISNFGIRSFTHQESTSYEVSCSQGSHFQRNHRYATHQLDSGSSQYPWSSLPLGCRASSLDPGLETGPRHLGNHLVTSYG